MELEQKYTGSDATAEQASHEDQSTDTFDFFYELLAEQRY